MSAPAMLDRRAPVIAEFLSLTSQGLRAPVIRSTINLTHLGHVLAQRWVEGLSIREVSAAR